MTAKEKKIAKMYGMNILAGVVTTIIAYIVIRTITNASKRRRLELNPSNTAGHLARRYRQAMNPSGWAWAMGADGTDEQEIIDLALATQGRLQEVVQSYMTLYNSSLTADLSKELDGATYQEWYNAVR